MSAGGNSKTNSSLDCSEDLQECEPCLRLTTSLVSSQSFVDSSPPGDRKSRLRKADSRLRTARLFNNISDRPSRETSSSDGDGGLILQIDRSNFCILSVLLLLLVFITAAVAFVLGQWSGVSHGLSSEKTPKEIADDFSPIFEMWRRSELREEKKPKTPIRRLPRDVIPVNYDLHLNLQEYISEDTVSGEVTILIECKRNTRRIILNMGRHMQISNASLKSVSAGNTISWLSLFKSADIPVFTFETTEQLLQGRFYKLFIAFKTKICTPESGVYCYRRSGNSRPKRKAAVIDQEVSLTTKLEPTHAKNLFPCWDEPDLKAIFNVSITHSFKTKVLSNAAIFKQTTDKKSQSATDFFHETPPMSTYLLALASGPLVAIEKESERGIKVSTWTLPEDHYKAEYASDFAVYIFNKLEEYFVVKYPLSKLDLVASRNFPVGGMENWGLVIFHSDMLLLDENEEGSGEAEDLITSGIKPSAEFEYLIPKYRTTKIIIHELLHQWFGNLVTMKWWSDLWLNEGFTTFYANYFVSKTYPMIAEYEFFVRLAELWTRQTYGEKGKLVQEFKSEEAIQESFDQWNLYCKGSVAIKMLWDLLGERTLRGGVIEYLSTNAYGNVERADLWRHLEQMSHFSQGKVQVDQVMESWVKQPGFPEIHILRNYEDRKGEIVIRQRIADGKQNQAFMQKPDFSGYEANAEWWNLTWAIPLLYIIEGQAKPSRPFWVWNSTFTFQDMDLKNSKWLLANSNLQFPYRINYDRRNWHMLIHALYRTPKLIPGRSRMQLILDSAVFLKDSDDLPLYIELLGYLRNESELLPLLTGLQHVHNLLAEYRASPIYPLLLICLRPIASQLVKRYNESFLSSEEQAIWVMDERRIREFHRFRCAVNDESCRISRTRAQQILAAPRTGRRSGFPAVCQFLHDQHTESERIIALRELKIAGEIAPTELLLLTACIREKSVTKKLSEILVKMQNLGVLTEIFGTEYSLHINRDLRQTILTKISKLNRDEKKRLFRSKNLTRAFLNSLRSLRELELAESAIPGLEEEKKYLRLKFGWMEESASPQIETWLLRVLQIATN